ncbi:sugar transferase [Tsukamurella spumae]|uniref:Sugar transferase n=1 Tax=Tsukamurella spumae TaxID=44753 RepID=A0A846X820_9ACTN|nr:sugar transferase [Tsukamurella spumae]NKY20429.1 sugar transferase [Tsukamurella spumae]
MSIDTWTDERAPRVTVLTTPAPDAGPVPASETVPEAPEKLRPAAPAPQSAPDPSVAALDVPGTLDADPAGSAGTSSARAAADAYRARLSRWILAADGTVALIAACAGLLVGLRQGADPTLLVVLIIVVHLLWFHQLTRTRPMDIPLLRLGSAELRRVFGTVRLVFGPLVVIEVLFPAFLPHSLVVVSGPVALGGILLSRIWFRRRLGRTDSGAVGAPTLVVGGYASATASVRSMLRAEYAGARIVGVCLPPGDATIIDAIEVRGARVPVVGTDRTVLDAVRETGAGVVVLTATDSLGPDDVRDLMWQLAEDGVELVVTAGVADVAGSRIVSQPLGQTPMMYIAAPKPSRSFGLGKRLLDLTVAAIGLLVAAPVMVAVAIAIKIDSRGPVFYRATRVGAGGTSFDMIKFRSMYVDADARRDVLSGENVGAGPLFKVKDDPRVTRVGRIIRRYSLDELPQFFNVLRGEMAVVGPRPALAHEVEQYPPVMRRRLLVKPGVTGAWQVSGRSDLTWDESIRLDVGYVENWSLGQDISIIARTVKTVLTSDGAY